MNKIEILKLPPYAYPEQVSSSHLTNDLNKAFKEAGFHTTAYAPTPCRGIDAKTRAEYKKIRHELFEDGSIDIFRFPLFKEGKNAIGRAIRYILCNVIQYHKGIKAKDIDAVYAGSTPPTQGVLCARVAKKLSKKYGHKVPFIYNLQDIFPDSLVNAKMTTMGSLLWKIGRKIEDYTYKNADKIITISEDFKANIMAKGVPEEKITVVPNWVNTDNVYPVERKDNILFDRYNLDRSLFYICYSGNIGLSQNMDMLLNIAKKIDLPDVRFVLIGDGVAKQSVRQRIESEKIGNVILLPFQDYSEIAHVFSLGDAGLIISKAGVGASSVPSKTWGLLAAARPVIASFDLNSKLAELINSVDCGIAADAGDEQALLNAIVQIYSNKDQRIIKGENGRTYLITYLDKNKCVKAITDIIIKSVQDARQKR